MEATALLEFKHKQTLEFGKFLYDGLFKLAPMCFLLNGLLFSVFAFTIKDSIGSSADVLSRAILLIGLIGVVYNCGAASACMYLIIAVRRITRRFDTIDEEMGVGIADYRAAPSKFLAYAVCYLTGFFFGLWIYVWYFLIENRALFLRRT